MLVEIDNVYPRYFCLILIISEPVRGQIYRKRRIEFVEFPVRYVCFVLPVVARCNKPEQGSAEVIFCGKYDWFSELTKAGLQKFCEVGLCWYYQFKMIFHLSV